MRTDLISGDGKRSGSSGVCILLLARQGRSAILTLNDVEVKLERFTRTWLC